MNSSDPIRDRSERGARRGAESLWQSATAQVTRLGRRRRRFRSVGVAVGLLAVVGAAIAIIDFDDAQPVIATSPDAVDRSVSGGVGRIAEVPNAGISVMVPDGWVFTTDDLSPNAGLLERFAVSTFEPRVGGARCAHLPIAALEQMNRTDAFVWMDERGPTGGNNDGYQAHVPGQRTDLDGIDSNSTIPECLHGDALDNLATLRWLPLHSAGRGFYLIVAIGTDADADLRTQVADVVASVELTPYVPILLERYASAVADEVRCLESAGATVMGPFPSIDGTNLIFDPTPTATLPGERLEQGQAALDTAGAECFERHTAEPARQWNASIPDGGDPALLAARRAILDCLDLPADATDAAVTERLTADRTGGITDSCTALTWTELGIEDLDRSALIGPALELEGRSGGCGIGVFFATTARRESVVVFEAQRLLEPQIRNGEPMTFELELPDPRVEVSLLVGPHADDEICTDAGSGIERLEVQDAVGGSLVVALSFDSETGEPLGDIVASSVVFEPASDGDEPLTLPPVTITGARVNSAQG